MTKTYIFTLNIEQTTEMNNIRWVTTHINSERNLVIHSTDNNVKVNEMWDSV